jgi:predicted O-linked N-acetylglucosamine transferase (SPINDLY family)
LPHDVRRFDNVVPTPDVTPDAILSELAAQAGQALRRGDRAGALACSRRAACVAPDRVGVALALLELELAGDGQLPGWYRRLFWLAQDDAAWWRRLTASLMRVHDPAAFDACRRALILDPAHGQAYADLTLMLLLAARDRDGKVMLARVAMAGDAATERRCVGELLVLGHVECALALMRRSGRYRTDASSYSRYLFYCLYDPELDPARYRQELKGFARLVDGAARAPDESATRPLAGPGRRMRLGILCAIYHLPHMRCFLRPLIDRLPDHGIDVVLYVNEPDPAQDRRITIRRIGGDDVEALAAAMRGDALDMLWEATGHGASDAHLVVARKPAPLIVLGFNYHGSSGLAQADAYLADAQIRVAADDLAFIEPVSILPGLSHVWAPLMPDVPVRPPPSLTAGHVTFGSLSIWRKFNERMFDLWAAVLGAVEGSRLVMRQTAAHPVKLRAFYADRFARRGIDPARIRILPWRNGAAAALDDYGALDIALDSWPFASNTTTFEALHQGVPVVTLARGRLASRLSAYTLAAIGEGGWIADTEERFVAIARDLAGDRAKLRELRGTLRRRLLASPACDVESCARGLAGHLRMLWEKGSAPGG